VHLTSPHTHTHTHKLSVWVSYICTRAVWIVRGLTLLIRAGTFWWCGDGLFFEVVPPLASDALLTTLHPLLENVLQTVCRKLQDDSGTGGFDFWSLLALSSLFIVSLHRLHRLDGWLVGFLSHFLQAEHIIQSRNAPLREYLSCSGILKRVLLKRP
jgi:hypothetical protein